MGYLRVFGKYSPSIYLQAERNTTVEVIFMKFGSKKSKLMLKALHNYKVML